MLVLTRKVDEEIKIGEHITVRIIEVDRGNVRLGIEAPRDVLILRKEVYERVQEQNLQSSQGQSDNIEKAAVLLKKKQDSKE